MSNPDNTPGTDAPTDGRQGDDSDICAFTLDDQTVFFDGDDAARWIQSDTIVELADVA